MFQRLINLEVIHIILNNMNYKMKPLSWCLFYSLLFENNQNHLYVNQTLVHALYFLFKKLLYRERRLPPFQLK